MLTALSLSLALAACGDDDDDDDGDDGGDARSEVEDAINDYFDEIGDGDVEGICESLTSSGQQDIGDDCEATLADFYEDGDVSISNLEIGEITVTGDSAETELSYTVEQASEQSDCSGPFSLVLQGDDWLVEQDATVCAP